MALCGVLAPHGRPIILLSDRQTTGGYGKIATVASVDISGNSQRKQTAEAPVPRNFPRAGKPEALYLKEIEELDAMRKIIHQLRFWTADWLQKKTEKVFE